MYFNGVCIKFFFKSFLVTLLQFIGFFVGKSNISCNEAIKRHAYYLRMRNNFRLNSFRLNISILIFNNYLGASLFCWHGEDMRSGVSQCRKLLLPSEQSGLPLHHQLTAHMGQ